MLAGLGRAVIVVEAEVTGGTLITATKAMEYGIAVFAVPGDVDWETPVGCNLLIRDGAHPVLDTDDLIDRCRSGDLCRIDQADPRRSPPVLDPHQVV